MGRCICVCVYIYMYVCVYVCRCSVCVYIYIYIRYILRDIGEPQDNDCCGKRHEVCLKAGGASSVAFD